eukprot:scaffold363_cov331-Pavlova_lutheri.AAC.91
MSILFLSSLPYGLVSPSFPSFVTTCEDESHSTSMLFASLCSPPPDFTPSLSRRNSLSSDPPPFSNHDPSLFDPKEIEGKDGSSPSLFDKEIEGKVGSSPSLFDPKEIEGREGGYKPLRFHPKEAWEKRRRQGMEATDESDGGNVDQLAGSFGGYVKDRGDQLNTTTKTRDEINDEIVV